MPSTDSGDDQEIDDDDYKPSASESSESESDHMKESDCVKSDAEPDESGTFVHRS